MSVTVEARPVPRTQPQPPAGVYERTREVLRERGHVTGTFIDRRNGRVCLVAALAIATGTEDYNEILGQTWAPTPPMREAVLGLGEMLYPGQTTDDYTLATSAICNFNNAKGTNPDALLASAAERYDG